MDALDLMPRDVSRNPVVGDPEYSCIQKRSGSRIVSDAAIAAANSRGVT